MSIVSKKYRTRLLVVVALALIVTPLVPVLATYIAGKREQAVRRELSPRWSVCGQALRLPWVIVLGLIGIRDPEIALTVEALELNQGSLRHEDAALLARLPNLSMVVFIDSQVAPEALGSLQRALPSATYIYICRNYASHSDELMQAADLLEEVWIDDAEFDDRAMEQLCQELESREGLKLRRLYLHRSEVSLACREACRKRLPRIDI